MTWILAADAGELTEDEAQELAAEQRELADHQRWMERYQQHWQRIGVEVYLIKVWRASHMPPRISRLRRAWNALLVLIPC